MTRSTSAIAACSILCVILCAALSGCGSSGSARTDGPVLTGGSTVGSGGVAGSGTGGTTAGYGGSGTGGRTFGAGGATSVDAAAPDVPQVDAPAVDTKAGLLDGSRDGALAGIDVSPEGQVVSADEWNAKVDEWLPGASDRAFVSGLMGRVVEPGKFANWIAPPLMGINRQPVDFQYVRFN